MIQQSEVTRYSGGAIFLHWLIAAALAGQLALGFGMPHGAEGFALMQLHKSVGIVILLLSLVRLGWRFTHQRPPRAEAGATGTLASAVHWGLYAFMILAPLTGWALVSTADVKIPTLLFGTVPWPHLPLSGGGEFWEESHEILAWVGLALFALHVAGALRHHFLMRDHLMGRMAPGGVPGTAMLLGVGVLAIGLASFLASGAGARIEHRGVELAREADAVEPEATDAGEGADAIAAEEQGEQADGEAPAGADAEPEQPEIEATAAAETAPAPPPAWTIQAGGKLGFTAQYDGSALDGSFRSWSGDIVFDPENPSSASIAIRIDLTSATLGDATQDQMLHGDAYFASAANPAATWRSRSVTRTGANSYRAEGTLSMKGVSRPQAITFTLGGSGKKRSVKGQASIDRKAFGVGIGPDTEGVAPQVKVDFAFDATSK